MSLSQALSNVSISGSAPVNTDNAVESFADVNGDGLPDKILAGKNVRLNLGYTFSEPVGWDVDRIQGGKSHSYSAGAGYGDGFNIKGIDKASSSFQAGFGLVTSESDEEYNLLDVNSDGLLDKVWKDAGGIMVALNVGNGFLSPISWKGVGSLNESASTSESANAAFTVSIVIPIVSIKYQQIRDFPPVTASAAPRMPYRTWTVTAISILWNPRRKAS